MPFDAINVTNQQMLNDLHILEKARHRIRHPQLWCRGRLISGNRLCMLGAIAHASGVSLADLRQMQEGVPLYPGVIETYDRISAILERYIPEYVLPDYNDDIDVTHTHVLALFDRAIADHRRRLDILD